MKKTIAIAAFLIVVVTGVTACNLVGGPACSGANCAQEQEDEGGEWEIDIDGHRKRKPVVPPNVVTPVKPIAPVKPAPPANPPRPRR